MLEENTENIEIESAIVPNDDLGDLISVLFQAGFSEEETDIVVGAVSDMNLIPTGELMLDEEIMKISDQFELINIELCDDDLDIIRKELLKRFTN